MARPLMQHGVGQLEEMFAKGSADPQVLKQLENELRHRQVPRAVALSAEVQTAMHGSTRTLPWIVPAKPPQSSTPVGAQVDLWHQPPEVPAWSPSAIVPSRPVVVPATHDAKIISLKRPPTAAQPIPVEHAYKLLNATSASGWESIEKTRQQLVQQSHPARTGHLSPEQRIQALAEVKRVNDAYLVLSQLRCCGS